ncbi:MAG: PilZ domain-containing protein [Candidatus Hydrogenedentes bacterium]|nr:PilZ domain-containing protein [Candidatus Hydrogenedentota bacterium]
MLGTSEMKLSAKTQDQLKKFDGRIVDLFGDSDGNGRVGTMNTKQCNRRHERYAVPVAAWIEFYGDTNTRGTISRDVSAEGARFSSIRPTLVGEPVIVRMQLGRAQTPMECKGRVVWSKYMPNRLHEYGVRFVDLSEEEQSGLLGFLTGHVRSAAYEAV